MFFYCRLDVLEKISLKNTELSLSMVKMINIIPLKYPLNYSILLDLKKCAIFSNVNFFLNLSFSLLLLLLLCKLTFLIYIIFIIFSIII